MISIRDSFRDIYASETLPVRDFEHWLRATTQDIVEPAQDAVRAAHEPIYAQALEEARGRGCREEEGQQLALGALGPMPRKRREFRQRYLTAMEVSILGFQRSSYQRAQYGLVALVLWLSLAPVLYRVLHHVWSGILSTAHLPSILLAALLSAAALSDSVRTTVLAIITTVHRAVRAVPLTGPLKWFVYLLAMLLLVATLLFTGGVLAAVLVAPILILAPIGIDKLERFPENEAILQAMRDRETGVKA